MKVSDGFNVADSRNLPKVNYLMLLEFMQENDCYNIAETRSAKALLASREAYVDTAVGYVEVKRENDLCTVQCRVTPEHKVKAALYQVTCVIDESTEKIVKVECKDCVASAGGCKHAICFTIWLIKRSDEPSVTSTQCYWNKPKLAGAVGGQKFVMSKDIGQKRIQPQTVDIPINLDMFYNECKRRKVKSGMILDFAADRVLSLNDFCMFKLMVQFVHQVNDHSYDSFKCFSNKLLTPNVMIKIEEETRLQASSKLWHSMRQGRVTGSRIHEAVHCKTENGTFVQSVLGGYKVPETKAIKRGKLLEKQVLEVLEKDFGPIQNTGLILITPIIGVSPDGICNDFVVEIKCPMTEKTMRNYVSNHKLKEKFKAQIMVQMKASNKTKGLFCVADPSFEQTKLLHKYWIDYDDLYVQALIDASEEFWKKYMFKRILDSAK